MDYIDELKDAIRRLHCCEADHIGTIPVTETFQGQIVWQGEVEVFNVRGHPKAARCCAWIHTIGANDKGKRFIAVLEVPPVTSAQTAVRAAIIEEARKKQERCQRRKIKRSVGRNSLKEGREPVAIGCPLNSAREGDGSVKSRVVPTHRAN